MRVWIFGCLVVLVGTACGPRPDPKCGKRDGCASNEFCQYSAAYGFMEDGNPNLINFDSYECHPLVEGCTVSSCACLTCTGEFACAEGAPCQCFSPELCTDGDHGAIMTSQKE